MNAILWAGSEPSESHSNPLGIEFKFICHSRNLRQYLLKYSEFLIIKLGYVVAGYLHLKGLLSYGSQQRAQTGMIVLVWVFLSLDSIVRIRIIIFKYCYCTEFRPSYTFLLLTEFPFYRWYLKVSSLHYHSDFGYLVLILTKMPLQIKSQLYAYCWHLNGDPGAVYRTKNLI